MTWYEWIVFFLMLWVLVSAGMAPPVAKNYMIAILAWPAFVYCMVMLAVAEKRGLDDPRKN